ncbi:MAG: penicillin acylase family protein [Myxococcales bacterium]
MRCSRDLRLYESQLTVPGLLNIYGASLMGIAGVLMGFNEDLGWTHTFSASTQTTLYQLALDPANPFRYKYGSDYRDITSRKVTIDVRQQDGSSQTSERTLYSSHYGPLLDLSAMGLKLSWTAERAISFKNSNVFDTTMASQYLAMWTARNLTEFKKAQEQRGNPWANTLYTDKEGNAYFLDSSRVPRLSAAALDAYEHLKQTDFIVQAFAAQEIVLLDGSDPVYEWEATVEPLERAPQLVRRDYVYNANDSYWLANPAEPLTGFSSLYGPVRSPLTPRTHMNMVLATEGGSNHFSFQDLQVVALSNRGYLAEKLVGAVLQRCQGKTVVSVGGKQVDISQACGVLGSWDKKVDLASVGAHVWREFLGSYTRLELTTAGGLFQDPFDPNSPLDTPSQLVAVPASGIDPVLVKLGEAVLRLQSAGIALDRALGDIQFTRRADRKISVHGGSTYEGVFNVARHEADGLNTTLYPTMARGEVINPLTYLAQDGYVVNYGSSFVMVLEFTDSGPRAEGFLTYGQSSEPTSPNASDQVERFAQKAWRPLRFRDADILADPKLETVVVEAR